MVKIIKVTKDRAGLHIFLARARAKDSSAEGLKRELAEKERALKQYDPADSEYKKLAEHIKLLKQRLGTKDAGHMPTARGVQRGIPAKTAEDLRSLHGAIRTHKDGCDCASCKGKKPKDAAIKAPPAKVSKTKSSEQAREIEAKLKNAKDCDCHTKDAPQQGKHLNLAGVAAAMKAGGYDDGEEYKSARFKGISSSGDFMYEVTFMNEGKLDHGTVYITEKNGRFTGDY